MNIEIRKLSEAEFPEFIREMREAFQYGYESRFGKTDTEILPESHVVRSLTAKNSIAYELLEDGIRKVGAIVVLESESSRGHLDFLYTKIDSQSHGLGQRMWAEIERLHHDIWVWETATPYFDTRNIHFYVNKLDFHIVEFFNSHHPDPNEEVECGPDYGMFAFRKVI